MVVLYITPEKEICQAADSKKTILDDACAKVFVKNDAPFDNLSAAPPPTAAE
jgi:hypothetical protein